MAAYSENFSSIIPYKSINASSICAKALNMYIYIFPAKYYWKLSFEETYVRCTFNFSLHTCWLFQIFNEFGLYFKRTSDVKILTKSVLHFFLNDKNRRCVRKKATVNTKITQMALWSKITAIFYPLFHHHFCKLLADPIEASWIK